MDNFDFLKQKQDIFSDEIHGCIFAQYRDGTRRKIDHVSLSVLEISCPLLATAFEEGRHGHQHTIEDTVPPAVASLLRYAYSSEYIPFELVNCAQSILVHLETYFLALRYDYDSLMKQVRGRIILECEIACMSDEPPKDLISSIVFIYRHLPEHTEILDTIINYCISCFTRHKLHQGAEFLDLAYESKRFHHDLCRINRQRGFSDDGKSPVLLV